MTEMRKRRKNTWMSWNILRKLGRGSGMNLRKGIVGRTFGVLAGYLNLRYLI